MKKIVKEILYEKFVEYSDPVEDLSIGVDAQLKKISELLIEILFNYDLLYGSKESMKIENHLINFQRTKDWYLDEPIMTKLDYEITVNYPLNINMDWTAFIVNDQFASGSIEADTIEEFSEKLDELEDEVHNEFGNLDLRVYGFCECGNELDDNGFCEDCDYVDCENCGEPYAEDELNDDGLCPDCADEFGHCEKCNALSDELNDDGLCPDCEEEEIEKKEEEERNHEEEIEKEKYINNLMNVEKNENKRYKYESKIS